MNSIVPIEYESTSVQDMVELQLNKKGYSFSNWIPAHPDCNGQAMGNAGIMVMIKQGATKFGREYREIEPDGTIN